MEFKSHRELFNKQFPPFSLVNCTGTEYVNTEAFAISVYFPDHFLIKTLPLTLSPSLLSPKLL